MLNLFFLDIKICTSKSCPTFGVHIIYTHVFYTIFSAYCAINQYPPVQPVDMYRVNAPRISWGVYTKNRVCASIPGENGTPGGNRTHNGPLGGGCYIHVTTEAYFILNVFPPTPGGYLPKPLKGSPRQSVASLARTHNGPEGARAVLSIELRKHMKLTIFPPTPGGYLPKPLKGSPRQSVASLARTHNGPEGVRAVLSIELRKHTSRYIIQYFQEKIKHFAADGRNL